MKSQYFIAIFILFVSFSVSEHEAFAQNETKDANALMPQKQILRYFTKLNNDTIEFDGMEKYRKSNFSISDYIFEKALKGEVEVRENIFESASSTYYINREAKILSVAEIESVLGMEKETAIRFDEQGREEVLEIQKEFHPEEIREMGFIEEWHLDEASFSLTKNVLLYDFVRYYLHYDEQERKALTISVMPELAAGGKPGWELACTKVYELDIFAGYNDMDYVEKEKNTRQASNVLCNDRNPFWNIYTYEKLVSVLFDKVSSGQLKTYDFKSKKEIDFEEVKKRMGASPETLIVYDLDGNTVEKTIDCEIIQQEIKSLLFIEDWYFDKKSLAIKKEIKGIAAVRSYVDYETNETIKSIPFVLFFDAYKK